MTYTQRTLVYDTRLSLRLATKVDAYSAYLRLFAHIMALPKAYEHTDLKHEPFEGCSELKHGTALTKEAVASETQTQCV